MMLKVHEKYHQMGPKDCFLGPETKPVASIDVSRATNQTGEQFHVGIPIYATDTREEVTNRIGFFLSIVQDRMEQENEATVEANKLNFEMRQKDMVRMKNEKILAKKLKSLKTQAQSKKWSKEQFEEERGKLLTEFDHVMAGNGQIAPPTEGQTASQ